MISTSAQQKDVKYYYIRIIVVKMSMFRGPQSPIHSSNLDSCMNINGPLSRYFPYAI